MTHLWLLPVAYLFGSICAAIVVSRLFNLPDPCQGGSKNPGATNVLRLAGKPYAVLVLCIDVLKGILPVMLARLLGEDIAMQSLLALVAVLGHMYPIFFRFQGGKGVATGFGAFFALNFWFGLSLLVTWVVLVKLSRYVSLASLITFALAPILAFFMWHNPLTTLYITLLATLVIFKHRSNLSRLYQGNENKLK